MQVVDNLQGRRRYVGGDGNLSHQILVGTEAKPFASKGFGFKPAQDLMPLQCHIFICKFDLHSFDEFFWRRKNQLAYENLLLWTSFFLCKKCVK